MKKKLLLMLPIAGILGLSFLYEGNKITNYHADGIDGVNFSVNPPAARTGAPGEGNCTACHSGATMSAEGVVDFTLSGGPSYTPGATYPMTVSTISGAKNGFELTVLDADGNQAGTLTAGGNTSVTTSGGREYVRHSTSTDLSWTFNWTAPDASAGELTAYYSVNISNDNGATSGDEIFLGNSSLPEEGASIEVNEIDEAYNVFFNSITDELNLTYAIPSEAKVVLNIQDLSGKLVQYYDFEVKPAGKYTEVLPVDQVDKAGIYVISLFVDNRVYNRKIMLD